MRDLLIVAIVLAGSFLALRRPWVGILVWTWLSIMNPHRFAWGFAYEAPLAATAAGCTLLGLLFTSDRQSPFKGLPVTLLLFFCIWITISWLLGFDPAYDQPQWIKVMKVYFMIFIGLMVMHTRQHILALVWVAAGSIALLAVKGGIFTIATGGNFRVWGPPGSFIADNNEMALATIITIPLLRFIQLQYEPGWKRHLLTLAMLLSAVSALGSHSRGAIIAMAAMVLFLWWRGGSRWAGGLLMAALAVGLLSFMPDSWMDRMSSIDDYQSDRSALGRISAWWTAWGVAKNHVFGGGFNLARADLVALYSPYPDFVHAAHSIYFQILGNHGFGGLLLWLGVFFSTYRMAGSMRQEGGKQPETRWCRDLGAMCQVSLLGYAAGGAFLSLSYFDLPYNIMMAVVLARAWMLRQAWKAGEESVSWINRLLLIPLGKPALQETTISVKQVFGRP